MAHTKSQKATKGNRDSRSKRLGVKKYGGETVEPGNIILTQRGEKVKAGRGTMLSRDFTIMAIEAGTVDFITRQGDTYVCVCQS